MKSHLARLASRNTTEGRKARRRLDALARGRETQRVLAGRPIPQSFFDSERRAAELHLQMAQIQRDADARNAATTEWQRAAWSQYLTDAAVAADFA